MKLTLLKNAVIENHVGNVVGKNQPMASLVELSVAQENMSTQNWRRRINAYYFLDFKDHFHITSFSSYLKNEPNKLESYVTLVCKDLPETKAPA